MLYNKPLQKLLTYNHKCFIIWDSVHWLSGSDIDWACSYLRKVDLEALNELPWLVVDAGCWLGAQVSIWWKGLPSTALSGLSISQHGSWVLREVSKSKYLRRECNDSFQSSEKLDSQLPHYNLGPVLLVKPSQHQWDSRVEKTSFTLKGEWSKLYRIFSRHRMGRMKQGGKWGLLWFNFCLWIIRLIRHNTVRQTKPKTRVWMLPAELRNRKLGTSPVVQWGWVLYKKGLYYFLGSIWDHLGEQHNFMGHIYQLTPWTSAL